MNGFVSLLYDPYHLMAWKSTVWMYVSLRDPTRTLLYLHSSLPVRPQGNPSQRCFPTLLPGFGDSLDTYDIPSARVMRDIVRSGRNRALPTPGCTGPLHTFYPLDGESFLVILVPSPKLYAVPIPAEVRTALCSRSRPPSP